MKSKGNRLGEIRAESDILMLEKAFLETADYRTLIESSDKVIVIGRRGTGKSALAYRLSRYWRQQTHTHLITLVPQEDQIIGIREILANFGDNFSHIKTGVKLAWQSLLLYEAIKSLSTHYKFNKIPSSTRLRELARLHLSQDRDVAYNLRKLISESTNNAKSPAQLISTLADSLHLNELKRGLTEVFMEVSVDVHFIIDKLDEGYEPDTVGTALVAGVVQATLDINSIYPRIHPTLFLRDNIFRAIAQRDSDYTRNVEGTELRLHWDEQLLLNLVAKRLQIAFDLDIENDIKLWNRITSKGLKNRDGFRHCLQLTLYRPRDLLALLNEAFYSASRHGRKEIVDEDIEFSANDISKNRLDDLQKEYEAIFPSIKILTNAFTGIKAEMLYPEIREFIESLLNQDIYDPSIQQDFVLIETANDAIRNLYSIGFLGIKEPSGAFKFCHDGRPPDVTFTESTSLLVHPCYWIALNISKDGLEESHAHEIYDDYEIDIDKGSLETRSHKLGQLISRLDHIKIGHEDYVGFEDWCYESLRIIFAGNLRNFEQHPNKDAVQRRDIVANNSGASGFWNRVLSDYKSRQVIFEIKNYAGLDGDEYRQMASYLGNHYGNFGFIIHRGKDKEPTGADLDWIRELWWTKKLLVIPLSYKWIVDFLSKLRNPQKHDAIDLILIKILDNYERRYLQQKSRH